MALTQATNQEKTVNGLTNFVNLFNAAATEIDRVAVIADAAGVGGTLASAKILVGSALNKAAAVDLSTDATISNAGVMTISAKAVTLAKMNDMATLSVLGRSTSATGVPEVLTAAADHAVLRRSGSAMGFGLLASANLDASAAIASTQLSSGVQTSLARADLLTRETASAGAILALPEGTNNGTDKVIFAAPAALTGERTITIPDANVTLANIAVSVSKVNDLIDHLSDGLLVSGALAEGTTPQKFKTSAISAFRIAALAYTKAAEDEIEFTAVQTVNDGEAATAMFGVWLVQVTAAGVVTTKAPGADQTYTSSGDAIAALPAPDASNVSLGYILVSSPISTKFTTKTTSLAGVATYVNGDVKTLPAKIS